MSASTQNEFPYQQKLYIREIEKTPISLLKFPLIVIEPDYELPGNDTTEKVYTLQRLDRLVDRYRCFTASARYATYASTFRAIEENARKADLEAGTSSLTRQLRDTMGVEKGAPMSSDQWLVPRPYDAASWDAPRGHLDGSTTGRNDTNGGGSDGIKKA